MYIECIILYSILFSTRKMNSDLSSGDSFSPDGHRKLTFGTCYIEIIWLYLQCIIRFGKKMLLVFEELIIQFVL